MFIHCRRDLRDIAVSCWMTDFRSIRWANHRDHIASRFHQYRRLMNHARDVLPLPIHHVDYEETVTDLESVARRLIAACGLDWEPACSISTAPSGRSARRASARSASRFISGPSLVGRTMRWSWRICLPQFTMAADQNWARPATNSVPGSFRRFLKPYVGESIPIVLVLIILIVILISLACRPVAGAASDDQQIIALVRHIWLCYTAEED